MLFSALPDSSPPFKSSSASSSPPSSPSSPPPAQASAGAANIQELRQTAGVAGTTSRRARPRLETPGFQGGGLFEACIFPCTFAMNIIGISIIASKGFIIAPPAPSTSKSDPAGPSGGGRDEGAKGDEQCERAESQAECQQSG
mmetsp:Transcript_2228/g.2914  ORF Transcript_2228/g.2914 Transcript_2228/m.2914 type:complete len:143 (-) Transcript_2228:296-724(-)